MVSVLASLFVQLETKVDETYFILKEDSTKEEIVNIMDVWPLIVGSVIDALNLDWNEVSYKRSSLIIKAVAFIVAVFFTTVIIQWRKKSSSSYFTGLVIDKRHESIVVFKFIRGFVWCL